ncbi:MAG TPA: hypothetical protein VGI66_17515 [Streptosporangiaceae bacterium]|jgi:hypothetical protein
MINTQEAPYPDALAYLVERTRYKEHWQFGLGYLDRGQGSTGLTLTIRRYGPDAYHPDRIMPVHHYFIVPAASYNMRSWQRWLFDRIRDVESHEAAEFFQICDSPGSEHAVRPYAPLHGPGNDPYLVAEMASDEDRRTSFRGELNPVSS